MILRAPPYADLPPRTGMQCGFNATIATVEVEANFWRESSLTVKVYECLVRDKWSPCLGSFTLRNASRRQLALIDDHQGHQHS